MLSGIRQTDNTSEYSEATHGGTRRRTSRSLSNDWEKLAADNLEAEKSYRKRHLQSHVKYQKKKFVTESIYYGKWHNILGMTEKGKYTCPFRSDYEGGFEDGMFHGEGILTYPLGQKLEGLWEKGKMIAYKFSNVDGLEYSNKWTYCTMPDRRFNISIREGLQPAGREFMSNQQPERYLEPGYYDTGDGFYNPITKTIVPARDTDDHPIELSRESMVLEETEDEFWMNLVTMVSEQRHEWIINHCRKSWDEPAGYRPDLYEQWISGRKTELEEMDKWYSQEPRLSDNFEYEEEHSRSTLTYISLESPKEELEYAGTGRKLGPSLTKVVEHPLKQYGI